MKRYVCPSGDIFTERPKDGRCPIDLQLVTEEDDGKTARAEASLVARLPSTLEKNEIAGRAPPSRGSMARKAASKKSAGKRRRG